MNHLAFVRNVSSIEMSEGFNATSLLFTHVSRLPNMTCCKSFFHLPLPPPLHMLWSAMTKIEFDVNHFFASLCERSSFLNYLFVLLVTLQLPCHIFNHVINNFTNRRFFKIYNAFDYCMIKCCVWCSLIFIDDVICHVILFVLGPVLIQTRSCSDDRSANASILANLPRTRR